MIIVTEHGQGGRLKAPDSFGSEASLSPGRRGVLLQPSVHTPLTSL